MIAGDQRKRKLYGMYMYMYNLHVQRLHWKCIGISVHTFTESYYISLQCRLDEDHKILYTYSCTTCTCIYKITCICIPNTYSIIMAGKFVGNCYGGFILHVHIHVDNAGSKL